MPGRSFLLARQAKKVLTVAEAQARNKHKISYDDKVPFTVCGKSLTPIYKGTPLVRCPYCGAAYVPSYKARARGFGFSGA